MIVPVVIHELCSGTSPEDPALQVHAPFRSADAAQAVLKAALGSNALLLPAGTEVFVRPRSIRIEAEGIQDAGWQGYQIDVAALEAAWAAYLAAEEAAEPDPPADPPAAEEEVA